MAVLGEREEGEREREREREREKERERRRRRRRREGEKIMNTMFSQNTSCLIVSLSYLATVSLSTLRTQNGSRSPDLIKIETHMYT